MTSVTAVQTLWEDELIFKIVRMCSNIHIPTMILKHIFFISTHRTKQENVDVSAHYNILLCTLFAEIT